MSVTEKTGNLVGILDVSEKEDLMITCISGVTIRMAVANINELGRATQGVKLIRLDGQDQIAAITQLDESKMEEDITNNTEGDQPENSTPGDGATEPTND